MKNTALKKVICLALSFWAFTPAQAARTETQARLSVELRMESEGMRPCPQSFDYCTLMIPAFLTKFLQITNNSTITATNITTYLPASLAGVTETSNTCASLAAGQTCLIGLTADIDINPQTLAYVQGSNTRQAFFYVQTA